MALRRPRYRRGRRPRGGAAARRGRSPRSAGAGSSPVGPQSSRPPRLLRRTGTTLLRALSHEQRMVPIVVLFIASAPTLWLHARRASRPARGSDLDRTPAAVDAALPGADDRPARGGDRA